MHALEIQHSENKKKVADIHILIIIQQFFNLLQLDELLPHLSIGLSLTSASVEKETKKETDHFSKFDSS